MAISSAATITRSSVLSGLNANSSYCATCGKASATTAKAFSGTYTGRGDSYVCATCNNGSSTKSGITSSTYNKSTTSSSSYCPSCNKTHSSTAHWSGGNAGSSSTSSSVSNAVSWAR